MVPDVALVARFAADLDRLTAPPGRIGLAVSGGPDSVALLLLAAAARPGHVEACTVDHGLRSEARGEAEWVAALCQTLGVPHDIRTVAWDELPTSAVQEQARVARYQSLGGWMRERGLPSVCTGHHRDDQAETVLMRLSRGAGSRGLGGMRRNAGLPGAADLRLLRPLLDWDRAELSTVFGSAGIVPRDDPSNRDERFERVRVRQWIGRAALGTAGVARSADHLQDAEDAIEWAVEEEWSRAVAANQDGLDYRPGTAPAEIKRRITALAITALATEGGGVIRGGELDRLLETLSAGGVATLRGVRCAGGATWQFRPAPGRVRGKP